MKSRETRRTEAEARNATAAGKTIEERLRDAYERPGESAREVARLRAQVAKRDH